MVCIFHDTEEHLLTVARNFIFDKKYSTRDLGKYQRLEAPSSSQHSTTQDLLGGGGEYLSGLQSRFSRHVHQYLGAEDEEEAPRKSHHRQTDGAQIQLTRR
jgi:phospholipase D1/2